MIGKESIDKTLEQMILIKDFDNNKELTKLLLQMVFNDGRLYQIKEDVKIYRHRVK